MRRFITRRPLLTAAIAFVLGATVVAIAWAAVAAGGRTSTATPTSPAPSPSPSDPAPSATPEPADPSDPSACSGPTVTVDDPDGLQRALDDAAPGDRIQLLPGIYSGNFVATVSGTPDSPIVLCGPAESVLDGGDVEDGYVLHLDGAQYWHLQGFTVTNGQKGVMADGTVGSVIEGLTVTRIGDEAIHLRRFSTDNLVTGNRVSDTGLRREKFGEGIYVGTAESNWCDISDCRPDTSDRNVIEGNTISAVTAEAIDVKEGTSFGIVRGNTFDGSGMVEDGADSWVDIKGSDWLITGNTGRHSLLDGFQTHEIGDGGWGTRNTFSGNTAEVNGPGFGYSLTPVRDNVVTCDNTASNAGEGFSNVDCSD
ncbi:MAG TPA: right-handed parallel beta-helix repeat-containing protein [Rhodoglobus sp.]|nr:right-handed parallel beta-helix repeat-containing protein [Rhodoglobus sp.]